MLYKRIGMDKFDQFEINCIVAYLKNNDHTFLTVHAPSTWTFKSTYTETHGDTYKGMCANNQYALLVYAC